MPAPSAWGAALLVVLGAMTWGTTGTSRALLGPDLGVVGIGALRVVLGGAGLVAVAVLRGSGPVRVLRSRPGVAAVGIVAVAAYQPLFFRGVDALGVGTGAMVTLAVAPLVAGGLAWAIERRPPAARWALGTLVALGGASLLLVPGGASALERPGRLVGVLAAAGAGAAFAVMTLASRRLLDAGGDAVATMAALFGGAAVLLLPALLRPSVLPVVGVTLRSARGLAVVGWLGLGTVVVGYLLYARGLERMTPEAAATLSVAEPLTAVLLGILVVGEPVTALRALGVGALVTGLVVSVDARPRSATPRPRPAGA